MPTLSLKLPGSLDAKITEAARETGTTRSAVVRKVLEEALSAEQRVGKGSCLALAKDLAGSVSGPRDLSVNKRHLRGYGA